MYDRSNEYFTSGLVTGAVVSALTVGMVGSCEHNHSDKKDSRLDALITDYGEACRMQSEVGAMPGGAQALLPAWEQVQKVIREEGLLLLKLPNESVPPQEFDAADPGPAFQNIMTDINRRYLQEKNNFGKSSDQPIIPQLGCDNQGVVSLSSGSQPHMSITPLTAANRKVVEKNFR